IWVNEDFTQITGYTLNEVLGKKPSLLQGAESEQEAIKRIREGLGNLSTVKDEITNYRKSGESYLCKLVIHPIVDEAQNLTHFIAFEVDGDLVRDEASIPFFSTTQKYKSSSLRGVEEIKLYYRLRDVLRNKSLYLNPDLSLKDVADELATNTKYLSQVVNHQSGYNFQHFINTYRIEEVKRKMLTEDYQHLTLYGIARQCGFKNKSTFYKVFKEITGNTPKAYIKAYLSEIQQKKE
ncbi:MAG: helix-turn-helix domain-containing protein, partial [Bacteroidota bacterium]